MTASQFRKLIEDKGKIAAVWEGMELACTSEEEADGAIYSYIVRLLNADCYKEAAIVAWGKRIFNPEPMAVRLIWSTIKASAKVLLQGGGSVGKSYSCIVWLLLDWMRDPEFTSVKIISTTAGHAKSNTFSTMAMLVKNCIFKVPGVVLQDYIGLDSKERHSGFSIVAIPDGDDGGTVLQGFHPIPRPSEHPTLGSVSRVRAMLDEAEGIPIGCWEGVDNMLTAKSGADTIKVIGAYNPKDPSTKTAQNAMPVGGWEQFDTDTGVKGNDVWISKNGWTVGRIDPAKTENVVMRREIYHGFQTYEGYCGLMEKNGGNTPESFTFGRGAYPPESAVRVVIQSSWLQRCRGEFLFVGRTIKCASLDTAVDGRDKASLTVARHGKAWAFQPRNGELIRFPVARDVVQIDQQFAVRKGSVKIVGDDAIKQCKDHGIAPEWFMIDSTGNGAQVLGYIQSIWSEDVQGLDFGGASTAMRILEQHPFLPCEKYDGIVTELWFALGAWMENLYLAISPMCKSDPLESELLSRRYLNIGKKMINRGGGKKEESKELTRVEKKDDQIKRLHHSPDDADSMTIVLHLVRKNAKFIASMTGEPKPEKPTPPIGDVRHGIVDRVQWLSEATETMQM